MLIPTELQNRLRDEIGEEYVLTDPEQCRAYGKDYSDYFAMPGAVVIPQDQQQIVTLVNYCQQYKVPLTTRGAGSGTTGAAVPIQGGIVLSCERMNRIIACDAGSRIAVVEAGATNQQVQEAVKGLGFFWAPDPGSGAYSTVGGNLACNAAGPHAVKYGTCRENTLGLTVVTGSGEIIQTGVYTSKSAVGYDLTRLLIGSEGTLGIITKAILKLTPLPETSLTFQAFYADIHAATNAITAIMAQPIIPSALEYLDGKALSMIANYANIDYPKAEAALIIEIDGSHNTLSYDLEKIKQAAMLPGLMSIEVAPDAASAKKIWETRKLLSPALKSIAPKKINEDIAVPVAMMPKLIAGIEKLGRQYDINIINFGHAGNGNIHVNLMIDPSDAQQVKNADICLDKIFDLVIELHGTLSGEHGVGIMKRRFVSKEIDQATLDIMRKIKAQFDPSGILNPGKKLP